MKMSPLLIFVGAITSTSSTFGQSFCDSVLKPDVFNVGTTSSTINFASHFKDVFCRTRWMSSTDLHQRSTDAGFTDQDVEEIIGLSFHDADSSEKRNSAYDEFCKRTDEDIAYSRTFYNTFRSSDGAVNAWQQCILHAEGHFGISKPSENLSGALVTLTKVGLGTVEDLKIESVQADGDAAVACTYNGRNVTEAHFPHNQREITITCTKPANKAVKFGINTNWGVFDAFAIAGYNETIAEIQSSIAALQSQVKALQGEKVSITKYKADFDKVNQDMGVAGDKVLSIFNVQISLH